MATVVTRPRSKRIKISEELKPGDKPIALCLSERCAGSANPCAYRIKTKVVENHFCPDCGHVIFWLPRKDRYPRHATYEI